MARRAAEEREEKAPQPYLGIGKSSPPDQKDHGGKIDSHGRVDSKPQRPKKTIPPAQGRQDEEGSEPNQERGCQPILPAPLGTRGGCRTS